MKQFTEMGSVPLQGGAITAIEKGLLPFGSFSMIANVRGTHPGFKSRKGQRALFTTADGTNKVLSMYQFKKSKISETHLFAQMSDGDILEAAALPPTVTTGVFGDEIFSGSTGQIAASWGYLNDILVMSNGVDQHQLYAGSDNYVERFIVYTLTSAAANMPDEGYDYTTEVTDGLTTTSAILDDLGTDSDQCIFILSPVRANRLGFVVSLPNGNSVTATVSYRKSNNSWSSASATDGTASGGKTLAQSGYMYWTAPSDEIPHYMYGICGFWYRITFSGALDAEVEISRCTYGTNHDGAGDRTTFYDLVNVWDGIAVDPPEIRVEHDSKVYTFASGYVNIGGLVTNPLDENDTIDVPSADLCCGVYIDIGSTPNTGSATAIDDVIYWTGAAWRRIVADDSLTITDNTAGLTKSGWVTWPRPTYTPQPLQIEGSFYFAYWYKLEVNNEVSDDVLLSIRTMPYFDIADMGRGQCNCSWNGRMVYSFTLWPHYLYVSDRGNPCVLNGNGYGILVAGDGRTNKVTAMRPYYNEMVAFQEEIGVEGGCITLFEGDNPDNFGKLLISTELGTMSNLGVIVVDGVRTATATEEKIKKIIFFISKKAGLCACDGQSITVISDDIQNYFDPTKSECIRKGYEHLNWISYDSADNVLRMGLVSGSSATVPNVFPVFDLTDKVFYFDTPAQEHSCFLEIDAGSGNVPTLQIAGGVDDGMIYQVNYGLNDVSTAIDSYITAEITGEGLVLLLRELMLTLKTQTAGDITLTCIKNDLTGITKTLSMLSSYSTKRYRRHRFSLRLTDIQISLKFQNNVADQGFELLSWGLTTFKLENR